MSVEDPEFTIESTGTDEAPSTAGDPEISNLSPLVVSQIKQLIAAESQKKIDHLTHRVKQLETILREATHGDFTKTEMEEKSNSWQKIGGGGVSNNEIGNEEAEPETNAGERYNLFSKTVSYSLFSKTGKSFQLPNDVYTILTMERVSSKVFWISSVVVAVQITLFLLLIIDTTTTGTADNPLALPSNVDPIVHTAQLLAIIIALLEQDDLRTGIESLNSGMPGMFRGDLMFKGMNRIQWHVSNSFRFIQGCLSFVSSFILALQAETVFDVLLNFLGVQFISNLDDQAFFLSTLGYFGTSMKVSADAVAETIFRHDHAMNRTRQSLHRVGIYFILIASIIGYFYLLFRQNSGAYSVSHINMEFSDDTFPFFGLYNGCYKKSETEDSYNGKLVYVQDGVEQDGGKFAFCNDLDGERAWTFFLGGIEDVDPCKNYLARSDSSRTFNLMEEGNKEWYTSATFSDVRPREYLGLSVSQSPCDDVREEEALKEIKFLDESCEELNLDGILEVKVQSRSFKKKRITDKINATDPFSLSTFSNPIYVGDTIGSRHVLSGTSFCDMLLFTGRRWTLVQFNVTNSNATNCDMFQLDAFFEDQVHEMIKYGASVMLVSEAVNPQVSPVGLTWYYPRLPEYQGMYNFPAEDSTFPNDIAFTCAFCTSDNDCYFGGICREDQTCDCVNGGYGPLCRTPPLADGICNRYFNTKEYSYDGGDCCRSTCIGANCGYEVVGPYDIPLPGSIGYVFCKDPIMQILTLRLKDIAYLPSTTVWCNDQLYTHFPPFNFGSLAKEPISFQARFKVPRGARCILSARFPSETESNPVSIEFHFGDLEESVPGKPFLRGVYNISQFTYSWGVPAECFTNLLFDDTEAIFDLEAVQGIAAIRLSNDDISVSLCEEDPGRALERYALTVFAATFGLGDSPSFEGDLCYGWGTPSFQIICKKGQVVEFFANENSLEGSIPVEIGLLEQLTRLDLSSNELLGLIPSELGKLTKLEYLDLSNNTFTGELPTQLENLVNLKYCKLWGEGNNSFTGTAPEICF